jgi:hypothetical protein
LRIRADGTPWFTSLAKTPEEPGTLPTEVVL